MKKLLIVLLSLSLFACEKEVNPEPPKTVEPEKPKYTELKFPYQIKPSDWKKRSELVYYHRIHFDGDTITKIYAETDSRQIFDFPQTVYAGHHFDYKDLGYQSIDIILTLSPGTKPNQKGIIVWIEGRRYDKD